MRIVKLLPLLALCLASSLAAGDDKNCSDLDDAQARQECMKHKSANEVDCSNVSDARARRECAQRKQDNSADCSKLSTADARQRCVEQKAK